MEHQVQHHLMEFSIIQNHSLLRHHQQLDHFGVRVSSLYLKPML